MALQIITGPSGYGKSKYVCDRVLAESEKNPKKNYFVIVPDQFTMQTQMDFVNASPKSGIMNIDILSFSRLAHRIFEETGGNRKPVLDDTGKSLVLRKIAGDIKDQVPVIGSNLNKQGYIHEVKSAISEFMQYGIGDKELDSMITYAKRRGALHYKLKDLQVLYRAFREYIKGHYITTEESMDILAEELKKSELIPGSVVVFDGFTGFTPIQEKVIGVLLQLCEQVVITVTVDGSALAGKPADKVLEECSKGDEQLFSFSEKTIRRLIRLAEEYQTEVLPVCNLDRNHRGASNPQLRHLEQHLFRYPMCSYEETESGKDAGMIRIGEHAVTVRAHKDMQEEVRSLCRKIRRILNETECAYRDIAVISGDLSAYESEIEEEFMRYEIPFFMDKTRSILLNPFIEYIKSALLIMTENFSYESVFHYLRSGLADFKSEEIDELENYVLEMGIRGRYAWSHMFVGRTLEMKKLDRQKENNEQAAQSRDVNAEEKIKEAMAGEITTAAMLSDLNRLREKLMDQLAPLLEETASQDISVRETVMNLYHFITKNEVEQSLHAYAAFFESQKDDARAKEYQQIYRLIMELFDQIIELIGTERMSLKEFSDILDSGFAEIEVGIIPRSVDRVIVGDMERTRLKPVKYLFFVGVNDGYIPAKSGKGGIISDIDREFLKGSEQELAPSPRDRMYIQKFYLYLNMTKPSKGLFLSYSAMDAQGNAIRPSYLVSMIKKMFPGCKEKPETGEEQQIGNLLEAKEMFCLFLRKYAEETITDKERRTFLQLLSLLGKTQADQLMIEHWVENAYKVKTDSRISQAAAGLLYGDTILSSISRMEKYASCAYSYFLQYGLSLKERELYGFESKDIGTIFHGVLENFSGKLLENRYTWLDFPEEEGKEMVSKAMEEVCVGHTDALLFDNALNRYTMKKMENVLQKCVSNISYQLKKGRFVPKEYEVSFQMVENLKELDLSLNEQDKMRLVGRIDRVDTYEKEDKVFVKIVDYKSGDKSFDLAAFYHGTQLQLVVYMNEAMRRVKKIYPDKEAVSAAMLYYHVSDPLIDGKDGRMSPEMVNGKVKEALRMKGIINADGEILEALDTSKTAKSDCVTLDYDSKGSLKSSTNAYSGDQMKLLSDYASYSLKTMGVKIKKGEIPLNPYASGNIDSCEYCAYKDVCGFDEKIPGYRKRNLDKEKDTDYLEKIKETMEESGFRS